MSALLDKFNVRVVEIPEGLSIDFVSIANGFKKVHCYIDDHDGIIFSASQGNVRGKELGEMYEYISDVVLPSRRRK